MVSHSQYLGKIARRILVGVCTLMAPYGAISVPALGQNSAPEAQATQRRLVFDPAHQPIIQYQDQELSIRLVKRNWTDQKNWALGVLVKKKGAAIQYIPLPHEMAQVNEIRRATKDKAVIIGMLNGEAWAFSIVDLGNTRISDTVWCYDPSLSPGGLYIAFIKFFPTHFAYHVEDRYMLYDLTLTPAQNRATTSFGNSDRVNAGMCVYPPHAGNKPGDNTSAPEGEGHFMAGEGFFWKPDSKAYLFADKYEDQINLVLVNINTSPASAAVSLANVPEEKLCGTVPATECNFSLRSIQFSRIPDGALTATFALPPANGTANTLQFSRNQFRPAD